MIDGSSFFLLLSDAMTVFAFRLDVKATPFPKNVGDRDAQSSSCGFEFRNLAGRKPDRQHLGSPFMFGFWGPSHARHYRIYTLIPQKDFAPLGKTRNVSASSLQKT